MNASNKFYYGMIFSLINLASVMVLAETVYYTLDNVILSDNTQITGLFSWTYEIDDFGNGVGQFVSLDIPYTPHDQNDLNANFDLGQSIEITLAGSVHDDGIDITLVLLQPLTSTTSSLINLIESKYEIGGNGFHDGLFLGGSIFPAKLTLSIKASSPGFAIISWAPDIPGSILQETTNLSPANWLNSASGGTNPIVVPTADHKKFYRLIKP